MVPFGPAVRTGDAAAAAAAHGLRHHSHALPGAPRKGGHRGNGHYKGGKGGKGSKGSMDYLLIPHDIRSEGVEWGDAAVTEDGQVFEGWFYDGVRHARHVRSRIFDLASFSPRGNPFVREEARRWTLSTNEKRGEIVTFEGSRVPSVTVYRHGFGVCVFPTGWMYEGDWRDGVEQGEPVHVTRGVVTRGVVKRVVKRGVGRSDRVHVSRSGERGRWAVTLRSHRSTDRITGLAAEH